MYKTYTYLGEQKTDTCENQNVLIIYVPCRQIASIAVLLALTKTRLCFLELVEITVALPLLKTSG